MRVGDLIEFSDVPSESQGRIHGIVLNVDTYHSRSQPTFGVGEPMVEVLWNNGLGWILQTRVRLVNEAR